MSVILTSLVLLPALQDPIDLGHRLELFVDDHLIESLEGAALVLHPPVDRGKVLGFDEAWEGGFSGYVTVLHDRSDQVHPFRMVYRGRQLGTKDNTPAERTCLAWSADGITWEKPELGLFDTGGSKANNVILAEIGPVTHNFTPLLDTRPGVPFDERYKGLGGNETSGLVPYASSDGIHWRRLSEQGVITDGKFDSQNVAFWSQHEGQYVCYFRTWSGGGWQGYRTVSRAPSPDFVSWSKTTDMTYGDAPREHLYTNQTQPCARAPHLYLATAARFFPGRRVLNPEQAAELGVDPDYLSDCSDGVLLTSRGGTSYQREFLEGFIRPGIGLSNWTSRTNYPACGVLQTGPQELSLYVQHDYAQPTAHVRRYTLRLDGFASAHAGYEGGQLVSKSITFEGDELLLNFATSAAGEVRVALNEVDGAPIEGFTLADCAPLIGNDLARPVLWKREVNELAGRAVRMHVTLKDADVFSFRFAPAPVEGHPLIVQGNGKLAILDAEGAVEWEVPWGGIHDVHVLDSGNVMVQRGNHEVVEIDRATKAIVWSYDATKNPDNAGRRVEIHAFQPLAGGRVMIAESGPGRIIEVERDGTVTHELKLHVDQPHHHHDTRLARKLASGNYLVCHELDGAVREYATDGTVVWDYDVPMFGRGPAGGHGLEAFGNDVFGAVRLLSGNTLIATGNGHSVLEVTPDKDIVWALHQDDLAGVRLAWVTTLEVLENGNLVIGNCHAGPGQPLLVEIDRATKEVLWTFDGYDQFGNSVPNTQLLDTPGAIR
ncbi:MAG: PQQ-binding-like beta-propeller repeat protein [Planctomycetota bacterium]|nr:PQQ-binding-like beta-propeller repeat protein [Planctomycetota bacterium]